MVWLLIDTHEHGHSRFGWLEVGKRPTLRTLKGRAGNWLRWLERQHAQRKKLSGICVVAGPGSFSAVRLGVLHANLLARLWKVPLYGVTSSEAQDLRVLSQRLARHDFPRRTYVAPVYDAEPNITVPAKA